MARIVTRLYYKRHFHFSEFHETNVNHYTCGLRLHQTPLRVLPLLLIGQIQRQISLTTNLSKFWRRGSNTLENNEKITLIFKPINSSETRILIDMVFKTKY